MSWKDEYASVIPHVLPAVDDDERRAGERESLLELAQSQMSVNLTPSTPTIVRLSYAGMPPSEIDRNLNLKTGTARAAVVAHWYDEKVSGRKGRL